MTGKEVTRYISLVNRRLFIIMNSGIDWKPEYGPELAKIDQEIAALRPLMDEEHEHREADPAQVPTMITITQAAAETGLSYDHLRKLCLRGEIVHVKAGRKFLINKEKLIGFLNNGEP
jgi:excisionase family DNA binding protein